MEAPSRRLRNWRFKHDHLNRHLPQDDLSNGRRLRRDTALSSKHRDEVSIARAAYPLVQSFIQ